MYPERTFLEDLADQGHDISTVTNQPAAEILKRQGLKGFKTLEESVKEATQQVLAFQN
jgi:hypothetical protein